VGGIAADSMTLDLGDLGSSAEAAAASGTGRLPDVGEGVIDRMVARNASASTGDNVTALLRLLAALLINVVI